MEVDHHRALAGERRCPDVQLEHILAHVAVVPILNEGLLDPREVVQMLGAVGSINQSGVLVFPGLGRLGRQPAVLAAGVLAVRHALEGEHAAIHKAANLAVLGVRDRGAGR